MYRQDTVLQLLVGTVNYAIIILIGWAFLDWFFPSLPDATL